METRRDGISMLGPPGAPEEGIIPEQEGGKSVVEPQHLIPKHTGTSQLLTFLQKDPLKSHV